MVREEVDGRMSRLLASLTANSTISTVYLLPQVNPVSGMRARGSGGREGGLKKEAQKCKLDNYRYRLLVACWRGRS